jgi:LacI family transcriptional regulator
MVTIYDVAKLAGVSPATVSRVYNGVAVSEEKAAAVRDAAATLQFTPNRTARTLRTQTAQIIALVIPDIENPYFTEMARGVEDVAAEAGYSVVLCNTDGDATKEAGYLGIAVAAHMAGMIIAVAGPDSDLTGFTSAARPLVAVDRAPDAYVDAVVMANRAAGEAATGALLDAGRSRVACIVGPHDIATARDRALGWRDAHLARGLEVDDELLRYESFRVEGGRAALDALFDGDADDPDGIVAGNNLIGVGVLQRRGERSIDAEALGVAVIGSLPFAALPEASVTTVRLPARDMGTTAARLLLERIDGVQREPQTVVLPGTLVRAATAG